MWGGRGNADLTQTKSSGYFPETATVYKRATTKHLIFIVQICKVLIDCCFLRAVPRIFRLGTVCIAAGFGLGQFRGFKLLSGGSIQEISCICASSFLWAVAKRQVSQQTS